MTLNFLVILIWLQKHLFAKISLLQKQSIKSYLFFMNWLRLKKIRKCGLVHVSLFNGEIKKTKIILSMCLFTAITTSTNINSSLNHISYKLIKKKKILSEIRKLCKNVSPKLINLQILIFLNN